MFNHVDSKVDRGYLGFMFNTISPAAMFTLFVVVGPVLAIALFTIGQLSGPRRRF